MYIPFLHSFTLFQNNLSQSDKKHCVLSWHKQRASSWASARRCSSVAVPGVRLGDSAPALHTDRCHSLRSLYLPLAALPSLPIAGPVIVYGVSASLVYGLIYWICSLFWEKAPLCKGGWQKSLIFDWGIVMFRHTTILPSFVSQNPPPFTQVRLKKAWPSGQAFYVIHA